jgi:hypothetical protein
MGKWKSFCVAGVLFCLVAAAVFSWQRIPVSDQELLANFAKAGDFFRGVESVRGLPWWSPNFLQGTSLAMAWGYMFSNAVMLVGALPFGFLTGSKVALGCCLLAGAAGMYFFLQRWNAGRASAWLGAALFLLNPSVLTRAAGFLGPCGSGARGNGALGFGFWRLFFSACAGLWENRSHGLAGALCVCGGGVFPACQLEPGRVADLGAGCGLCLCAGGAAEPSRAPRSGLRGHV